LHFWFAQVWGEASILFPLLVAQTFAKQFHEEKAAAAAAAAEKKN
jgi:phosphotransferase system  glucose/maltose/N-acetylglucosamine-specific IIC component